MRILQCVFHAQIIIMGKCVSNTAMRNTLTGLHATRFFFLIALFVLSTHQFPFTVLESWGRFILLNEQHDKHTSVYFNMFTLVYGTLARLQILFSRSYNILHPFCSLPLERLHRGPFGRDGLPFSHALPLETKEKCRPSW